MIRFAEEKDAQKMTEWMLRTPDNAFDADIAKYPNLRTMVVDENVFVPFHPVFAVESLAHKPDITPRENARALRQAQNALEALARQYGMAEIYWMCKDETLVKLASRHGYEVISLTLLRKKVL